MGSPASASRGRPCTGQNHDYFGSLPYKLDNTSVKPYRVEENTKLIIKTM